MRHGDELTRSVAQLLNCARVCGRKDGFGEGLFFAQERVSVEEFELAHVNCVEQYAKEQKRFDDLSFPIVDAVVRLSRRGDGIAALRQAFEAVDEPSLEDIGEWQPHQVKKRTPKL